jgi:hypothetical protein
MTTVAKLPLVAWNKDTAFITQIHNAIIAAGLVLVADSGDMNPASPPAYNSVASTSIGYLVYRFDDALQATVPIFIKLAWEVGTTTNSVGVLPRISIGTASDGAGTLTGATTPNPATLAATTTTADPNPYDCYVGGDESMLVMLLGLLAFSGNYGRTLMVCERLVDANGVPDAEAAKAFMFTTTTTAGLTSMFGRLVPPTGAVQSFSAGFFWAPSGLIGTSSIADVSDGSVPVFPVSFWTPNGVRYSRALIGVHVLDLPNGAEFELDYLGERRRYISLGTNSGGVGMSMSGAANSGTTWAVLAA